MKKNIVLSLLLTFPLLHAQESKPATYSASSEKSDYSAAKIPMPSPRETIHQDFSVSHIKISYSRPSIGVSKRKIFGALVPFDQLWRTGAGKATTITFGQAVKIDGNILEKGEYALYTIPKSSGKWMVIFSEDRELFTKDTKNGVPQEAIKLQIEVEAMHLEKVIETFSIGLGDLTADQDQCKIWIGWEHTGLSFKVEVADQNIVIRTIEELIQKGDQKIYFQAAHYYSMFYAYKKEIMMEDRAKVEKALGWLKDMTEDSKNLGWHIVNIKLLIILKDKTAAQNALEATKKIAAGVENYQSSDFAAQINQLKQEIDALPSGKTQKASSAKKTAPNKKK
jgi:hypothetical protein